MSEYSELIKRFDKIRDYMRDFYVYGFQSRDQLSAKTGKSGRSYDNEKRRIESYLSDFMSFHQDSSGKNIFLSVDSGAIPENPLYRAFKAKTFTKNDIALHFCILDLLADGQGRGAGQLAEELDELYFSRFAEAAVLDVSTVRKKLIEYEGLGVLRGERDGKTHKYYLDTREQGLKISREALAFFSEVSPLGAAGSFLMDRENMKNQWFSWKHHYIMPALDSEILWKLLDAMHQRRGVRIVTESAKRRRPRDVGAVEIEMVPLKVLISVQGGRRYVMAYEFRRGSILTFRLDYIKSVIALEECAEFDDYRGKAEGLLALCWGVSLGRRREPERLSMTLRIGKWEGYVAERVGREGRHGALTQLDETTWRYDIDVWDAAEMLPWLRTFIGRIIRLECSNPAVTETFYRDLELLCAAYGLEDGPELSPAPDCGGAEAARCGDADAGREEEAFAAPDCGAEAVRCGDADAGREEEGLCSSGLWGRGCEVRGRGRGPMGKGG